MGYFDEDAQEMLEIYLLETKQLARQFSEALLNAEDKGAFSQEDLHSVFRAMHTIKSSSAMMGLEKLSSMAHKLEDLFAYYREEFGKIENAESDLFDLLYMASDFIESELDEMVKADYCPGSTDEIEQLTHEYLNRISRSDQAGETEETELKAEGPSPVVPEAFAEKSGVIVRVLFESGCRMENIRAFMLLRQISAVCREVESYPDNLEKSQDSAKYIDENGVFIRFEADDKEKVLEMIRQGLFVTSCEVLSERKNNKEEEQEEKKEEKQARDSVSGNIDSEFLQVRMERLDQLQNLASELMISTLTLDAALEQNGLMEIREGVFHHINRLITDVEKTVMEMRMVPVSRMIPRLQRVLREVCRNQQKEVDFNTNCGDIEADKSVIEYLYEALIHIIRNAVDHGIESPVEREACGKPRRGTILFSAENTGGELRISVSDDGRGIDEESVRRRARERGLFCKPEEEYEHWEILELVLTPGFTTNEAVTEYSGRGVGLDVVKKVLEDAGGHLYMDSKSGEGSIFTITVPLSLATMECTRFQVGECRFSVPSRYVHQFLEYDEKQHDIREENNRLSILYDNSMIPLVDLRKFYELDGETPKSAILIYLKCLEKEGCILVDGMYTQKRIVVKPLPAVLGVNFRTNTGIGGFSVMGNGKVCAALDIESLFVRYEREGKYGRNRYK
ncbi:MAG: ATP-binding protein [Eubacteriales bacterium]|nr:ATP-binding protein [Eubacteriales bacterium]